MNNNNAIDAHIHLDMYSETEAQKIVSELDQSQVEALIAVSRHLASCLATERLSLQAPNQVYAAYGFHPEQEIPHEADLQELLKWISERASAMVAVGEIGLPYYRRLEAEERGEQLDYTPYVQLFERFLELAAKLEKPVVLHAVYEDADIVCDLLEKHGISKAHFHWFKGSPQTVQRMIQAGYYISITPDVLYEEEIRELVRNYPLELLMVETDGPWPFEGIFAGQMTHPRMIHKVIEQISLLHAVESDIVAEKILHNTKLFYNLFTLG
ncbi:TatD family hydrolase [Paenibacillus sp. CGMCC 1.16610]|uniref:TatD family deoxyribonuclease n=1 Tax=Paenibacillus anseongense TaxID=2682845 RepID=A0ABW9UJJ4_9BACL|nr:MULTISPECIES: TatD family hydrolase [Paenibacillus]MBA2941553.1 TatD family hydrolase [Paenibacillus sp. CGMCC 1.16610]MVQ40367.1 TatD family deoxyribonuclease [Paenibacillus anseongense]